MRGVGFISACLLVITTRVQWGEASFLDYIWPDKQSYVGNAPSIPFEIMDEKDKFLENMAQIFGAELSKLDYCHQRVVLNLKNSCHSLNEEQLSRLAIELINCQLAAEGRPIYECSESMSLEECTKHMTSEALNNYYLSLSRARSVCLIIRQEQFRAVSEMTVNRLMESVNQHLDMMEELKKSQKQLETATFQSIDDVVEKNLRLLEKQQELLKVAEEQRLNTESNLKNIIREKETIRKGQNDINNFIIDLKAKIGDASDTILNQNMKANQQIHVTINQLKDANEIVQNFSQILQEIQHGVGSKIIWLNQYLGRNQILIKEIEIVLVHVSYLLIGMICLVFVNADSMSRIVFLVLIALNMTAVLYKYIEMNMSVLTETIAAFLTVIFIAKLSKKYDWRKYADYLDILSVKSATGTTQKTASDNTTKVSTEKHPQFRTVLNSYVSSNRTESYSSRTIPESNEHVEDSFVRSSPPRYNGYTLNPLSSAFIPTNHHEQQQDELSNHSRSSSRSTSIARVTRCKGTTHRGLQCSNMSRVGSDYCRVHESAVER